MLSLIDDFPLNLNDMFEEFFYTLLGFLHFNSLDVTLIHSFMASIMYHFDWVYTESFRHLRWHMVFLDKILVIYQQIIVFLRFLNHL